VPGPHDVYFSTCALISHWMLIRGKLLPISEGMFSRTLSIRCSHPQIAVACCLVILTARSTVGKPHAMQRHSHWALGPITYGAPSTAQPAPAFYVSTYYSIFAAARYQ
jgi:hypothetical protein